MVTCGSHYNSIDRVSVARDDPSVNLVLLSGPSNVVGERKGKRSVSQQFVSTNHRHDGPRGRNNTLLPLTSLPGDSDRSCW